jgi:hypothetical protein
MPAILSTDEERDGLRVAAARSIAISTTPQS